MVLGALDYRVTPSNRYIQDLLNRDGITGRGGFNLVDVDDVARGHLLAADKGRAGGSCTTEARVSAFTTPLSPLRSLSPSGPLGVLNCAVLVLTSTFSETKMGV
jgi:hypothetical protein